MPHPHVFNKLCKIKTLHSTMRHYAKTKVQWLRGPRAPRTWIQEQGQGEGQCLLRARFGVRLATHSRRQPSRRQPSRDCKTMNPLQTDQSRIPPSTLLMILVSLHTGPWIRQVRERKGERKKNQVMQTLPVAQSQITTACSRMMSSTRCCDCLGDSYPWRKNRALCHGTELSNWGKSPHSLCSETAE